MPEPKSRTTGKAKIVLLFGYALLGVSIVSILVLHTTRNRFSVVASDIWIMGNSILAAIGVLAAVVGKALMAIEERISRLESR